MKYLYVIIPAALLLLLLIFIIILHFRKKAAIRKVNSLSETEKDRLLDTLGEPLGYLYNAYQDIFVSRHDAPQRVFGYTSFYDFSAPYFNMVFDYEPIYFDYNCRTWLIEIWKGQYGINSGCELGIYYADDIIPPDRYKTAHFQAVDYQDMLEISLQLNRHPDKSSTRQSLVQSDRQSDRQYAGKKYNSLNLGYMKDRHWWLTIFDMGIFSKPEQLFVHVSIQFKDYNMMHRFLHSFKETLPGTNYRVNGLTVYFTFNHSSRRYSFFKRTVRRIALWWCKFYCKWFLYVTRPFSASGDRLLYLYYYLPFVSRSLLRNKKCRHGQYR